MIFLSLAVVLFAFLTGSSAQSDGTDCSDLIVQASENEQILTQRAPGINGCQARITSPPGTNIKITVIESNCQNGEFDLGFYVPGETDSKMRLCRAMETDAGAKWTLPLTFLTDNELFLYETSSDLTFRLEYSYVPLVENICSIDRTLLVGAAPKTLTSPNYGIGPYLNNEDCTVTIKGTSPSECQIGLKFTSRLETGMDMVKVCPDVPKGDPNCTAFGSTDVTNNTFTAVNETTVTFTSDMYGSWDGFVMEYSCIRVTSQWSQWRVTGCERSSFRNNVLLGREERYRTCLIDSCDGIDLSETRLSLCFEECRRTCSCYLQRIWY